MEQFHLLRSKLSRPRPARDLIHRPRALGMLNRHSDREATLVCAPAGFGKTTLLSDWLSSCPAPSAWLSLDEQDSDLDRFLAYFVAAVRIVFPSACAETTALLRASILPPQGVLITTLCNDLDRLVELPAPGGRALPAGQRLILVLDDCHLIREPHVPALLSKLLRYPPRALHLVLSTRIDPPFPLHTLRARGQLTEIRTPELRFTREEIAAFMEQALGAPLDADALASVVERSEGWVTGLRLAALTVNAGGEVAAARAKPATENRYVLEYLLNEVFSRVPVTTQDFLLKTSILDRLTGPLCNVVTGWEGPDWDGRSYLAWLAAENLFTFALDAEGTWYRYHHLFRSLLQRRLERQHSREEIAGCHLRASSWFARNGFIEEAIQHALAAGDEMTVVQLVEAHRHKAMNYEHWRRVAGWLRLIPRRLVNSRPELLMLEAWMLQQQWRIIDLPAYLDRIEFLMEGATDAGRLPESDRIRLSSEIDCLRSCTYYYVAEVEKTRISAERALRRAPLECSFVRAYAWFYSAVARQLAGNVPGAVAVFHEGLKEDRLHGNAFPMRLYVGLCSISWISADLRNLMLNAEQMLHLGRQRNLAEAVSWAHYEAGCALYQMDRLAEAEKEFAATFSQPYVAHDLAFTHSGFGLASVFMARNEFDRARESLDTIAAYALETTNKRIMADAESFRACLDFRAGAVAAAAHWAAGYDLSAPPVPMTTFHVERIGLTRVLVWIGTPASLAQADEVLSRLNQIAAATQNIRCLVEILALQALVLDARGDEAGALKVLKRALLLAEPGGVIRVFVDLGPRTAVLLAQLAVRGVAPDFLPGVLAAFGSRTEPQHATSQPLPDLRAAGTVVRGEDSLIEPLSPRELEVLELLGEWLTNKEIARELTISPQTVKRHTVNIYQKLAVGTRRAAVAKAVALGLLAAPSGRRARLPEVGMG